MCFFYKNEICREVMFVRGELIFGFNFFYKKEGNKISYIRFNIY